MSRRRQVWVNTHSVNVCIHVSATVAETVATDCEVTVRSLPWQQSGSLCLYMVREEASSRRSVWLYLFEQEYSLEERWVDETRDFLSSSSASPALLCSSLTPSICFRALQWQLFTQTSLLQPLACHRWILQFCEDKHENLLLKRCFILLN